MSEQERIELLMIISRFEGYLIGNKLNDEQINTELDRAVELLKVKGDL